MEQVAKLLIVEDEIEIAEMMKDFLSLSGFEVHIETDGESGLKAIKTERFDTILLDVMLPKKDGFTLCSEARRLTDVPILFVTARKSEVDLVRGLSLGADDYVTKPFTPTELLARVKAHLVRYRTLKNPALGKQTAEVISCRGLRLYPGTGRATLKDRELELSLREFQILLFLAKHPNHPFSKDEIFRAVWQDEVGDENAVAVYIRRLRSKIETDPKNPEYLRTAWGQGYLLQV